MTELRWPQRAATVRERRSRLVPRGIFTPNRDREGAIIFTAGPQGADAHAGSSDQSRDCEAVVRNALPYAALVFGLAILWLFTPPDLPLCGFRQLTGRPCPLCGLTHAVFALAKGRVAEALHLHALSPLAVMMLAGTFWSAPRMARLWAPCIAAFGIYGCWRLIF